ncbi:hypothetical protein C8R48DRAFT_677326 [Suillus tomentosus]|nr:hypothetical protein C8R48DRAFT_677326 [Suillus tomentosus]
MLMNLNDQSPEDAGCTKVIFMQSMSRLTHSPCIVLTPVQPSLATIFLCRVELRIWQTLTLRYSLMMSIISLVKSIDIQAESAVKLLSEFLDLGTPYIEGQRHPNAEHFAHGVTLSLNELGDPR